MTKQVILGAHFPGVNNHTVWSDPAAGSQIAFSSFAHLARTAEAGLFDFFFLPPRPHPPPHLRRNPHPRRPSRLDTRHPPHLARPTYDRRQPHRWP
jgi:hypothetical protein